MTPFTFTFTFTVELCWTALIVTVRCCVLCSVKANWKLQERPGTKKQSIVPEAMKRLSEVIHLTGSSEPVQLMVYGKAEEGIIIITRHRASTSTRWHFAFTLYCHGNRIRAAIANLPNTAQLGGTLYHPPRYNRVRAVVWACGRGQTDRHTEARDHYTWFLLSLYYY